MILHDLAWQRMATHEHSVMGRGACFSLGSLAWWCLSWAFRANRALPPGIDSRTVKHAGRGFRFFIRPLFGSGSPRYGQTPEQQKCKQALKGTEDGNLTRK